MRISVMRSTVILALSLLCAGELDAQSCPAADSVAGPEVRLNHLHRAYDRMTDTTRFEVEKASVHLLAAAQDATFRLGTSFEGQEPHGPMTTTLTVAVTTARQGRSAQVASRELNKIGDAEAALVLVDQTTRLRLPRVAYSDRVRQENLLHADRLQETATFAVTPEQLRAIVSAHDKVEIAAGMARGTFGHGEIERSGELYRLVTCTQ
jgi:hypothetical protein